MITKILLALCMVSILGGATMYSLAAPQFESGNKLGPHQCHVGDGQEVISVSQKVLNGNETGLAGNTWAFDNFTRIIHVWKEQSGSFCAVLFYDGQFDSVKGTSPSGNSTIANGVQGTFRGGERTTLFSATLNAQVPTKGSIGTFDYKCNTDSKCPGLVKWQDLFFTNVSGLDISWFGFVYNDTTNTWINSSSRTSGDIS